ncbi:MAG: protein kinase [Solirubrobacteraceae bacterium]
MSDGLGRIDRYELVREIGRGGMAIVYLARQTGLNRYVALKRLNGVQLGGGALAERFERESQLTAQLAHERIVTVHDYFEADGTPYIAMEYLPGGSLRPHVKTLDRDQALTVLGEILEGLTCAEENQVVHRDLKPENVLLTTSGHVKIADFGIAKAIGELTGGPGLTATGLALGTPTYMAPEQALGRPVTSATDRYALGVMAYELLTGTPPFVSEDSPMALLYQHVNEEAPSLEGVVDQPTAQWVASLLSKEPAERFADHQDALDHLHRLPRIGGATDVPTKDHTYETWTDPIPPPPPVVVPPPETADVGEVVELADTPSELGFVQAVPEPEPEPSQATVELTAAPQRPLPPEPPTAPLPVEREGRRRRGGLIAAAVLAALAAVAALAVVLTSGDDDDGGGGGGGEPQTQAAIPYAFGGGDRQQVVVSVVHEDKRRVVVIHGGPDDRRPSDEIDSEEAGLSEPADEFGWGLSSGDFNRDGLADLTIGTNSQQVVSVGYGEEGGGFRFETLAAADAELPSDAGAYGFPLLAADFDDDGFADLAVAAPGRAVDAGAGAVQLVFGGPDGLQFSGARVLTLDGVQQFGRRLRAGDVDGDGALDLVEAAPDLTTPGHVSWCRGGSDGPTACELLADTGGSNVTTGDLDDDGFDELVVGVAEQTGETTEEREAVLGKVEIWPGSEDGPADPQTVDPSGLGLPLEIGDRFGAATDAGDIDGDPGAEVVVGAPGLGCAYVLKWSGGAVRDTRELVPCDDVPVNFGSSLTVLDVTPASELDVVVAARRAEDPDQRLQIVPGGETALEPLGGVMSNGRGTEPAEITVGRRAGGGL